MASYDWQLLYGTELDVWWRDLHVSGHWAQVNPDGSWAIYEGKGKKARKVGKGFEGTKKAARQTVREWEQRKMRDQA